jgi:hypothetical protein
LKNLLSKTTPQLQNDVYFIDRPSEYFDEILHYVQTGIMRKLPKEKKESFDEEVKFYEILPKKSEIKENIQKEKKIYLLDKSASSFKFKGPEENSQTFEVSKEILEKNFSSSLLYTMITTQNTVHVNEQQEIILEGFNNLEVSVVFNYILKNFLQINAKEKSSEYEEIFDKFCITFPVKEEIYIQNGTLNPHQKLNNVFSIFKDDQIHFPSLIQHFGIVTIVSSGMHSKITLLSHDDNIEILKRVNYVSFLSDGCTSSFENPLNVLWKHYDPNSIEYYSKYMKSFSEQANWKVIIYSRNLILLDKSTMYDVECISTGSLQNFPWHDWGALLKSNETPYFNAGGHYFIKKGSKKFSLEDYLTSKEILEEILLKKGLYWVYWKYDGEICYQISNQASWADLFINAIKNNFPKFRVEKV